MFCILHKVCIVESFFPIHLCQEQIALVLNQLPDRSREIFLLSRFRGLKNREIAEKLQISTTAVEKHIARALQYFSRHFSERYPVDLYIVILAWLMMEQK